MDSRSGSTQSSPQRDPARISAPEIAIVAAMTAGDRPTTGETPSSSASLGTVRRASDCAGWWTIRLATAADAEGIARVQVATWRDTYAELDNEFWEQFTPQVAATNWRNWMAAGAAPWVAEAHDEVIGFALVREGKATGAHEPVRDLEVYALYVQPSAQGSGIGRALLEAALDPASPAQLWVSHANTRAIGFYCRHGFELDGAHDDGAAFHNIAVVRMVR